MTHNEASLMKLKKKDMVKITLYYRGKFNSILDYLKKDISDLKSKTFLSCGKVKRELGVTSYEFKSTS